MPAGTSWAALALLPAMAALFPGCSGEPPAALEVCEPREIYRPTAVGAPGLDLLFVIDNSASMATAQASLAEHLPAMMHALISGDLDGDGAEDVFPVADLHVAVISTDMGAFGFDVPSCSRSEFGDDGLLRTAGDGPIPGCSATYPPFLGFRAPGDDPTAVGLDLACLVRVGTTGCEVEQPLEATLKALHGSTSGVDFYGGTFGHGDGANAGFQRLSAATAIVVLSDDDDCSVMDSRLLDPSSTVYVGDLKSRCSAHPEALQPIARYAQELLDAAPRQLIYAPILGVPERLLGDPWMTDYAAILADPVMQVTADPSDPMERAPSCVLPDGARAFPPRRHLELARQLDLEEQPEVVVQSLCSGELLGALRAIVERIGWVLERDCFMSALTRDEEGFVDCERIEVLDSGVRCDEVLGRTRIGDETSEDGDLHAVCRVEQLAVIDGVIPAEAGWYYDDFSARALHFCGSGEQRLAYTTGARPVPGTSTRFECALTAYDEFWTIGSPCPTPGAACAEGEVIGGRTCSERLGCDPETNTFQKSCVGDGECRWTGVCGADGRCTTENCRG